MMETSSTKAAPPASGRNLVLPLRRRVIFPECYKEPQNPKETEAERSLSPKRTPKLPPILGRKELDKLFPASPCVAKAATSPLRPTNKIVPSFPQLSEHEEKKEEDDTMLAMLPCGVRQRRNSDSSKLKHVHSLSTSFFAQVPSGPRRKFLEISPYTKKTASQSSSAEQPMESILKPSSYVKKRLDAAAGANSSTEESTESIPSLASTDCSEDEHSAIGADDCCITPTCSPRRAFAIQATKGVVFDPRVLVCEFRRSREELGRTWYTPLDMDKFKRAALQRVIESQIASTELIPTGTGRLVRRKPGPVAAQMARALFTDPALSSVDDEDDSENNELCLQRLGKQEIRHILVVDPYDICLKLFAKSIRGMLPHVTIATARSSEEAMRRLGENKLGFDMVIVEERLKLLFQGEPTQAPQDGTSSAEQTSTQHMVSGAALFRVLKECTGSKTLFVGVTSQPDKYDEKLREGGADVVWSKPPPVMDKAMRDSLLKLILNKRGKKNQVDKHFV